MEPAHTVAVAVAVASPMSSLPDGLRSSSLSLVCRRFSLLLYSPAVIVLRRSNGRFHVLFLSDLDLLDSAALPAENSGVAVWEPSPSLPKPSMGPSPTPASPRRLRCSVSIIGRGATLRYGTWTGAITPRAPTLFSRKKFASAAIDGKIYAARGDVRTSAEEEYDPAVDAMSRQHAMLIDPFEPSGWELAQRLARWQDGAR